MNASIPTSSLIFDFTGQVAIITGGADGLGFGLAGKLAQAGAIVAIFDRHSERLEKACRQIGDSARAHCLDVTDHEAVAEAVNTLLRENGHIDILVNCAGVVGQTGIQSHQVTLDDFDEVMRINLRGCLVTSQSVLPSMVERGYGRILHVASISGKEGNAGMLAYSTSKAAVIGLAKVQGKEYATTGVTINAIAPAVIRTAMVDSMPEHQVKYMTDKIPMQRCGEIEEFARLAACIVSPDLSFTTGFTFDLTGGRAVY